MAEKLPKKKTKAKKLQVSDDLIDLDQKDPEAKYNMNIRITWGLRNRITEAAYDKRMPVTKFMIWLFEEYAKNNE